MHTHTAAGAAAPIIEWLVERVAGYLDQPAYSVDTTLPLAELGLDSVSAVSLCGEVEDEWDLELDATVVFDHPTIAELAGFIANEAVLHRESAA
ncbi:acyl carrier protein [Nocardia sp. NPDC004860]|uniref:acyl carrier protein n=1 Tax=Nocardia sp. NPDC004860 TaxID=3154557 RepID=UPI0033BC95EE